MIIVAIAHLLAGHYVKYSPFDRLTEILGDLDPESAIFLVDAFAELYGRDLANLRRLTYQIIY